MLDLSIVTTVLTGIQSLLTQTTDAAPGVVGAVQSLATQGQNLVNNLKNNFDNLVHPKMTEEETKAALDKMQSDLDVALGVVKGQVPPALE